MSCMRHVLPESSKSPLMELIAENILSLKEARSFKLQIYTNKRNCELICDNVDSAARV